MAVLHHTKRTFLFSGELHHDRPLSASIAEEGRVEQLHLSTVLVEVEQALDEEVGSGGVEGAWRERVLGRGEVQQVGYLVAVVGEGGVRDDQRQGALEQKEGARLEEVGMRGELEVVAESTHSVVEGEVELREATGLDQELG